MVVDGEIDFAADARGAADEHVEREIDAAFGRVFDGDDAVVGEGFFDGVEDILNACTRDVMDTAAELPEGGLVGEGAFLAEVGDGCLSLEGYGGGHDLAKDALERVVGQRAGVQTEEVFVDGLFPGGDVDAAGTFEIADIKGGGGAFVEETDELFIDGVDALSEVINIGQNGILSEQRGGWIHYVDAGARVKRLQERPGKDKMFAGGIGRGYTHARRPGAVRKAGETMAGIEEYGAEGGRPRRKQKKAEAKPKPPPAKKKVPVNPSGIFKAVDVPKVLREPGDFKPRLDVNMNQVNRDHMRVRIYEDIVVAYKFLKRADGTAASGVLKGELLDISEGGLQFEGELAEGVEIGALKAGDILVGMNVFLPYVDGRMKVLGQVTWQKAGETEKTLKMGVRFIDMDDAARAVLKAYFISSQMPGRRKKPPEPD